MGAAARHPRPWCQGTFRRRPDRTGRTVPHALCPTPASSDGTAPITDILAAERARSDAYWRNGIAQLQAQAAQAGAGDGAVVLLEVAARSLAQSLGSRQVARILRDASDRYAAEGDRPRDAGAA
jgi:hypothetical protein